MIARFLRPAALAASLLALGLATSGPAHAAMSDAQRREIETVIKEYLLKNPEVIQEAVAELEKRETEGKKQAQASALKSSRDVLLNSPRANVVGNPNGDVTLVEFFDYNCGYCKRALGDVRQLVKADPKLRVVLRDFPVLGPESVEASRVALAVKNQIAGDKLFDYHVRLIETRGKVNGERALAVAREMGLDLPRIQRDLDGPDVKAALAENADLGEKLSLTGTPAFVIGDEIVPGAVGADMLRAAITEVRRCGKASC